MNEKTAYGMGALDVFRLLDEKTAQDRANTDAMYDLGVKLAMSMAGMSKEARAGLLRKVIRTGKQLRESGGAMAQRQTQALQSGARQATNITQSTIPHVQRSHIRGAWRNANKRGAPGAQKPPSAWKQRKTEIRQSQPQYQQQAQQMGAEAAKGKVPYSELSRWGKAGRIGKNTAYGAAGLTAAGAGYGLYQMGQEGTMPYGYRPGSTQYSPGIRNPSMAYYNPQEYARGYYGYQ